MDPSAQTPPAEPRALRAVLLVAVGVLVFVIAAAGTWLILRHGTQRAGSVGSGGTPSAGQPPAKATPPATVVGATLTWRRVTDPSLGGPGDQKINAISEAGGNRARFVAAGYSGHDAAVWISTDGATWQKSQVGLGGPGDQVISGINAGNQWTAVGRDTSSGNADAAVWTSADARTWVRVNDPVFGGPGDQIIYRVTGTKFGQIAVGSDSRNGDVDAALWIHQSGAWREVTGGPLGGTGNQVGFRVRAIGSKLVAVGTDDAGGDLDAAIWVSSDSVNWLRVPDPTGQLGGKGDQGLLDIVPSGTGMVAGGFATGTEGKDGALWRSEDGVTWTRVPGQSSLAGPGDQEITRMNTGLPGFKFAAFGIDTSSGDPDAAVWTSVDGSTLRREVILGGSGDQGIQSLGASQGLVLLVGFDSFNGNLDAAIWATQLAE
jgi:hypothetical protein